VLAVPGDCQRRHVRFSPLVPRARARLPDCFFGRPSVHRAEIRPGFQAECLFCWMACWCLRCCHMAHAAPGASSLGSREKKANNHVHPAPMDALTARGFLPVWHCKSRPRGMGVRKSASQPPGRGRDRGDGCFRLSRIALDETIVTVSPHPGAAKARPQWTIHSSQRGARGRSRIRARRDASSKQASKHLPAQAAQAKTRQPQTPVCWTWTWARHAST
jgi:hypothetical protein